MGPLSGVKVIELAGLGPTPFCGMMLGDMGADVIRIDRPVAADLGVEIARSYDLRARNKRSVVLDLRAETGKAALRALIAEADILLEGFRPGVLEKLGFSPEVCHQINPRLVIGRATGWGQSGPRAMTAGHDINYISVTGVLDSIGSVGGPPVPPLNLLGDYAGGGAYLAFGLVCAVLEARSSGLGQVVDGAMVDGVTSLMCTMHAFEQSGDLLPARGTNLLDGGAPFYACYETSDGKYMAAGPIEERFYQEMLALLGLSGADLPDRRDRANWPAIRDILAARFKTRSRAEWTAIFEGTDACVSPVLGVAEVMADPHNADRHALVEIEGVRHPQPAPRLSRTPGAIRSPAPVIGAAARETLHDWGIAPEVIATVCP